MPGVTRIFSPSKKLSVSRAAFVPLGFELYESSISVMPTRFDSSRRCGTDSRRRTCGRSSESEMPSSCETAIAPRMFRQLWVPMSFVVNSSFSPSGVVTSKVVPLSPTLISFALYLLSELSP